MLPLQNTRVCGTRNQPQLSRFLLHEGRNTHHFHILLSWKEEQHCSCSTEQKVMALLTGRSFMYVNPTLQALQLFPSCPLPLQWTKGTLTYLCSHLTSYLTVYVFQLFSDREKTKLLLVRTYILKESTAQMKYPGKINHINHHLNWAQPKQIIGKLSFPWSSIKNLPKCCCLWYKSQ